MTIWKFSAGATDRITVLCLISTQEDILTDLGAAISGGMGLAAGANLNPEREYPSMFEPIHGSAPDIAGQGKANPLATVWSASQMLEFFGHQKWADRLIDIIEETLVEKTVLTPDLGGTATTEQVGDEVIRKLAEKHGNK